MAKTKKASAKAGNTKQRKTRGRHFIIERNKKVKPLKIVTVEKGEMILDDTRLFSISKKNFGTPRKPLTRITLRSNTPGGGEEVLHLLEGPRKFLRRFDSLFVPAKPPKQKLLKRTFKKEENRGKEIKQAVKAFIKKYRFTPNIIRFNLALWKNMTSGNTAPGRIERQKLQNMIPALQGAEIQDAATCWFHNHDGRGMLMTINSSLKKNEFELHFSPMGGFMQENLN